MRCKRRQYLFVAAFCSGRVIVHTKDTRFWEILVQNLLDLLRSCLKSSDIRRTAYRTFFHPWLFISAIVTDQSAIIVLRQSHITMWAFQNFTTGTAGNKSCIPSPVQKKNCLFSAFQSVFDSICQTAAQNRTISLPQFFSEIYNAYLRKRSVFKPGFKLYKTELTILRFRIGFQRRCRRTEDKAGIFHLCTVKCSLSRMIPRTVFALVGLLMFFIYNNKTEI